MQETFEIEIPDEAAQHLATVGQIVAFVQQKLGLKTDQQ
jgi:acyl carrier protein